MQTGPEDNLEARYAIKFCVKLHKNASETYEMIKTAYGEVCMSRGTVLRWLKRFQEGRKEVRDAETSGHQTLVDQISKFLDEDRRASFVITAALFEVQPTALQASSHRNKEIENLIKKQRNLTLADWREDKECVGPVNHSSLWADGRHQIFSSRKHPRKYPGRTSSRVEVFSNHCKHCGGRK